uniref:Uncharacterized protein n=1 Tax=Populus trichocarpa TaxID=3694 RepID=A0A2K2AMR4_POPTR
MVEEKMVSTSFGGVADYEEQAPGASVTYARTLGAGAARLERTWRLGLGKSSIGYGSPSATWCWVSPSARWRKGSTSVRKFVMTKASWLSPRHTIATWCSGLIATEGSPSVMGR